MQPTGESPPRKPARQSVVPLALRVGAACAVVAAAVLLLQPGVREPPAATRCAAQLRQLGALFHEHVGAARPPADGAALFLEFLRRGWIPSGAGDVLRCPGDRLEGGSGAGEPDLADPDDVRRRCSYAVRDFTASPPEDCMQLAALACDAPDEGGIVTRHAGGLNVLFTDGSVRFLGRAYLGIPEGEPIVVGPDSPVELLRPLVVVPERISGRRGHTVRAAGRLASGAPPGAVVRLVVGVALLMMVLERLVPGRLWPRVSGWWTRALALNGAQVGIVFVGGIVWDPQFAALDVAWSRSLHPVAGALLGYVTLTFVYYWWHRARHRFDALWRVFHQVHHSPQRIEILTSFYKHPAEILANGLLSSAVCYLGLGLSPAATSGAVLLTGLAELVYHWNVRTPYWLGFVFQRPESHCVHHQEGLHAFNYADLPLWDMLFGTFRNPRTWDARCGLGAAGEQRLGAMLRGIDVSRSAP